VTGGFRTSRAGCRDRGDPGISLRCVRESAAVAITGDAGIGKTVVWQHLLQAASRSSTVLSCRPAPAERPLAFSALDDLFGDVAEQVLPALSGPRRRAVELALLRDASIGTQPEPRGLARGMLDTLRILSAEAPVVVAVDDARWLDRPSAGVLEFCFRRLRREPVTVLLTFRDDSGGFPLGLDLALPADRLGRVRLGPVGAAAIGEIIRSRLGTVLARSTLTRLHAACGGNPFYALEYARALAGRPQMSLTNEPIPIPDSLSDLMRQHVRQLTRDVRQVGRLVAASADPRERLIRAAGNDHESWAAIDQAGWPRSTITRAAGCWPSRRSARPHFRREMPRRCARTPSRNSRSSGAWPATSPRPPTWRGRPSGPPSARPTRA
jgi:AAA ATPase domain